MTETPGSTEARSSGSKRRLMLFVAGDEPNSRLARSRLRHLTSSPDARDWQVDVVDVLEDPSEAIKYGIPVAPALVRVEPEPRRLLFGDLSNRSSVCTALGLPIDGPAPDGVVE